VVLVLARAGQGTVALAIAVSGFWRLAPLLNLKHEVAFGGLHLLGLVATIAVKVLLQSRQDGYGLPKYVEKEFERCLECGILAHGFAHFHCDTCGTGLAVPFSCKTRGFCRRAVVG
jgi:hypothetical protein